MFTTKVEMTIQDNIPFVNIFKVAQICVAVTITLLLC